MEEQRKESERKTCQWDERAGHAHNPPNNIFYISTYLFLLCKLHIFSFCFYILVELHIFSITSVTRRRTLTWLHKGPCAIIKQITFNNLPWLPDIITQSLNYLSTLPNAKIDREIEGEWCKKWDQEEREGERSKENTKWEENDLREEVLQGSIYTYPSRARAARDSGVSSPGLGHSCLSSYSIRQGLKWIKSSQALCEFIRSCSCSRCTDR